MVSNTISNHISMLNCEQSVMQTHKTCEVYFPLLYEAKKQVAQSYNPDISTVHG